MKRIATLVLALALVLPSVASADPVQMDWKGTGKGTDVNLAGIGWVFAGELKWTLDSGLDILTFCVDLTSPLGDPQLAYTDNISNLTGASSDSGKKAAWLYNTYAGAAHQSNLAAAALQVAIWQVIGGSSIQVLGSSVGGVGAEAQSLLLALAGANYSASDATWLDARGRGQDQVTRSVPEPGTLLLLGAGAMALAARRRRLQAG